MTNRRNLEADHYRFGFEADAPDVFYAVLDLIFQRQNLGGSGSAAIDDCQSMSSRDANVSEAESFGEAGVFDQPCGRNFLAGFERGITGYGKSASRGAQLQIFVLRLGEHRILEERARALAIGVSGNDEHTLERTDVAHGLAGLSEVRRGFAALEVTLEVGVGEARAALGSKRVGGAENDETPALAGVEYAGAVAELAGFSTEFAHLIILQVENLNRSDRVGDFLSVGADVLHRRATHAARNAAEALDAGAVCAHGVRDKLVPRFAGADLEKNFAGFIVVVASVDTLNRDFEYQTGPTSVRNDEITAAAENEKKQVARACQGNGFLHLTDTLGFDEILRRASDFDGGEGRERNVFEQEHESFSIYTRAGAGAHAGGLREFSVQDFGTAGIFCSLKTPWLETDPALRNAVNFLIRPQEQPLNENCETGEILPHR